MKSKFSNKYLLATITALLSVGFGSAVQADLVTSAGDIPSATVIDFSEFGGSFLFTSGPVQIGNPVALDIEWFSTNSNAVIGNGGYGLGDNGGWDSGRNGYTGLNTDSGSMTFQFNDGPVAGVGGFMNYAVPNFGTPTIEVLDQGGAVLESYDILALAPISTPNGTNEGAFRGIVRPQADIYALRLLNGYDVLDDLTFSAGPREPVVPVPTLSTWALMLLAGLLGIAAFTRRRALT